MSILNNRIAAVAIGATTLIALGGVGGAVAGSQITGQDIKNQSVEKVDLGAKSVGYSELNDQLREKYNEAPVAGVDGKDGKDGADSTVPGPKGDKGEPGVGTQGPKGDKGDPGTAGTDGTDGADGVAQYEVLNAEKRWSSAPGTTTVNCLDNKVALGGGFVLESIRGGDAVVKASQPVYVDGKATGWTVSGVATGEANVKAWVICAAVN